MNILTNNVNISCHRLFKLKKCLLDVNLKIVIVPHKNPDADALGSALGLFIYLKNLGHEISLISPTYYSSWLKHLPEHDKIEVFSKKNKALLKERINNADAIFLVDLNSLSRTGYLEEQLKNVNAIKILMDHHLNPDNFDLMFSDPDAAATAIIVFRFIKMMGHINNIDRDTAVCLYTAIVSDTGYFRFSSVTPEVHIIAAYLRYKGPDDIHDILSAVNTHQRIRILAKTLQGMQILSQYSTVYMSITSSQIKELNYKIGDPSGFVNNGLEIQGILFSVLFIEYKYNIIKIYFRSKGNFDVNNFARIHFMGGGHKNAAGGSTSKTMS